MKVIVGGRYEGREAEGKKREISIRRMVKN